MARIIVYHASYGCDTGCCGHIVQLDEKDGKFNFDHPYGGDHAAFVRELVTDEFGEEHCKDIDWDGCVISED